MKRYTLYLFSLIAFSLTACQQEVALEEDSCCTKPLAADALPDGTSSLAIPTSALTDMSLYQLESDWHNERGEELKLREFQGKVRLVAMIYTHCGYACPRIVADLKRIEMGLEQYKQDDIGIVLVTMDPARDTPERLFEFAKSNNLDPQRWTLLTSEQDNIRELAALLNMKYKVELDGEISHSNIISVLNVNGEIIHQAEGLGVEPDETVNAIKSLLLRI
ncbi:SCO family protein [Pontibacter sp. HSC-14F20]|uniref:SCO family protein n=1 Tax=Pontibacter sp. HSC-14F20 TaxID=2864136 RepID=UPI001C729D6E|nr:SCO family protein [Pontibacter sp. HSC-14F20]MBX0332117.1 SCO family protein [Pontibacter sp. HSC-14F20]